MIQEQSSLFFNVQPADIDPCEWIKEVADSFDLGSLAISISSMKYRRNQSEDSGPRTSTFQRKIRRKKNVKKQNVSDLANDETFQEYMRSGRWLDDYLAMTENAMSGNFFDGVIDMIPLIQYQPFKPDVTLKELAKRAQVANISRKQHAENLKTIAIIGMVRGYNISKIKKSSSEKMVAYIDQVVTAYNIVPTPATTEDVTIHRIGNCMTNVIVKGIGNKTWIVPTVKPMRIARDYPKFMCVPSFAMLIPHKDSLLSDDDVELIKLAFAFYQYEFHKITNKKSNRKTILHYIDIKCNNSLYTMEYRKALLCEIGLLTRNNENDLCSIASKYREPLSDAASLWKLLKWIKNY